MRKHAICLIIALAAALSGCATSPDVRSPTEVDTAYVASVERSATRFGVDVVWVNPPRKVRSEDDG